MADEIPDIYTDNMQVTTSVFGVNITFGCSVPHPVSGGTPMPAEPQVRIRMSLEHAKIVAMLLRRQLKGYEETSGTTIQIPYNVYTSIGVADEDW